MSHRFNRNEFANTLRTVLAAIALAIGLILAIPQAHAQSCHITTNERVIYHPAGNRVQVTEYRRCGNHTTTRYYYSDPVTGYSNHYSHDRHRWHRHRGQYRPYGNPVHYPSWNHNRHRYYPRHYPHVDVRVRGRNFHFQYRGRP